MRHLVYNVRYSVVPIDSSLLTLTLHYLVLTTLIYKGKGKGHPRTSHEVPEGTRDEGG
jgi:hypothetical protein